METEKAIMQNVVTTPQHEGLSIIGTIDHPTVKQTVSTVFSVCNQGWVQQDGC